MARPDLAIRGDKNPPGRWYCSRHGPVNIIPFNGPVVTAVSTDCPFAAFDDRAVRYSPVVAPTRNGRKAGRSIVPHVKRQIPHAFSNYLHHIAASDSSAFRSPFKQMSLPSPSRTNTRRNRPGICAQIMPGAEIGYLPLGTRHTPPPAFSQRL